MNIKRIMQYGKEKIEGNMTKPHRQKELTPDEEDKLERNLVWIFASPRSGTSWLGNQLLTYNTLSMDEPYLGQHIASLGIIQNRTKFTKYHQKRESYIFCDKYAETWRYYLRKLILNRIFAQFENLEKKIIIKEPNGSFGCDQILSCLPKSKFLLLLRDGRDVIDSLIDAKRESGWATKLDANPVTEKNRKQFIKNQAKIWKFRTEHLLKTFEEYEDGQKFRLKYEDLRKNTKFHLEKIYKFIGVNIPDKEVDSFISKYSFENISSDQKGSGKVTRSASPGKWQENFTKEEQDTMNEIMGDTLKKTGYEK